MHSSTAVCLIADGLFFAQMWETTEKDSRRQDMRKSQFLQLAQSEESCRGAVPGCREQNRENLKKGKRKSAFRIEYILVQLSRIRSRRFGSGRRKEEEKIRRTDPRPMEECIEQRNRREEKPAGGHRQGPHSPGICLPPEHPGADRREE